MPIRIFNNISSLTTTRALDNNNNRLGNSVARIASGTRVNRAADDGASFTVSEFLRSDTRVLKQAEKNANSAINLLNTAEGGLSGIATSLIRLRELAVQASSGTLNNSDRNGIQLEYGELMEEIDHIANVTQFNGEN